MTPQRFEEIKKQLNEPTTLGFQPHVVRELVDEVERLRGQAKALRCEVCGGTLDHEKVP